MCKNLGLGRCPCEGKRTERKPFPSKSVGRTATPDMNRDGGMTQSHFFPYVILHTVRTWDLTLSLHRVHTRRQRATTVLNEISYCYILGDIVRKDLGKSTILPHVLYHFFTLPRNFGEYRNRHILKNDIRCTVSYDTTLKFTISGYNEIWFQRVRPMITVKPVPLRNTIPRQDTQPPTNRHRDKR